MLISQSITYTFIYKQVRATVGLMVPVYMLKGVNTSHLYPKATVYPVHLQGLKANQFTCRNSTFTLKKKAKHLPLTGGKDLTMDVFCYQRFHMCVHILHTNYQTLFVFLNNKLYIHQKVKSIWTLSVAACVYNQSKNDMLATFDEMIDFQCSIKRADLHELYGAIVSVYCQQFMLGLNISSLEFMQGDAQCICVKIALSFYTHTQCAENRVSCFYAVLSTYATDHPSIHLSIYLSIYLYIHVDLRACFPTDLPTCWLYHFILYL